MVRRLPPPPDFAVPVGVPVPRVGDSFETIAARERAGRLAANRKIIAFRDWYEVVSRAYETAE